MAEKARGIDCGGIGAIHLLAWKTGLIMAIDENVHVLKRHIPYHESDHVLNIAYNTLTGGTCLDDTRRQVLIPSKNSARSQGVSAKSAFMALILSGDFIGSTLMALRRDDYYLNFALNIYYGLKRPLFKGRFAILILTIIIKS